MHGAAATTNRMFWPAMAVNEAGLMDAASVSPEERKVALHFDFEGRACKEEFPVDPGDVVVFQRPSSQFMPDAIRLLQARGVAVVVDMDDDLARIHPSNPAWMLMHPRSQNSHSWHTVTESCRLADMVVVTTPTLARRYGAHGRVRVIPNFVPAAYLRLDHQDSTDVGWAGSTHSHPDDLQQMGAAVARLVQQGTVFRTVGDPAGVARALGLAKEPPSTGPVPFAQYPASIAQFGVGVAPVAPTQFNQAKSRLKPLEYTATGVPWVASSTDDYDRFHRDVGVGLVAAKRRDWERMLRRLVGDEPRRREMSEAGRVAVRERHTIEGNAWRWAEAWADAAENRRRAVLAPPH